MKKYKNSSEKLNQQKTKDKKYISIKNGVKNQEYNIDQIDICLFIIPINGIKNKVTKKEIKKFFKFLFVILFLLMEKIIRTET